MSVVYRWNARMDPADPQPNEDGTHYKNCNLTMQDPWTYLDWGLNLTFEDCNLTNCILPASATVIVAGNVKNLPTLPDGRKYHRQHEFEVTQEQVEVEPGIFETCDVERSYRVTGTPDNYTRVKLRTERNLGISQ